MVVPDINSRLDASKSEIRLLVVEPDVNIEAEIRCTRRKVSLNDAPDFEALSYVWGDPKAVDTILLDGFPFQVTLNAHAALKALRHHDRPRVLWVDAISINQEDSLERASQVRLMGLIYRSATSVRVWLGPDDDADIDAIPIIKALNTKHGMQETFKSRDPSFRKLNQVRKFFARAWWTRLWVVQEVALAQHVTFHQGSKEVEYKHVAEAYRASDAYFRTHNHGAFGGSYGAEGYRAMEMLGSIKLVDEIRELCGSTLAGDDQPPSRMSIMTWATIANLLRSREATVDKDRLYALYGLLPSSQLRLPGMEPSYTITTEEAFINTTYSIMESSQSLLMFNFLCRRRSDPVADLPSWVPDWRLAPSNKYEANLRVVREALYNAAKNEPFHLRRLSSNTICVKGCFIDIVRSWHPASLFPADPLSLHACYDMWHERWDQVDREHATYLDGVSRETAFRRTVAWDCGPGNHDGQLQRLTEDEELAMFKAHDLAVKMGLGDDSEFYQETLPAADSKRTDYMMNCAKERSFITTDSGIIGMSQNNVELEDHIFIIAGNSHPVILRPSANYADTWHAVAECYLQGFMDGEGITYMHVGTEYEKEISAHPIIQAMKGTERNPRWDEITEEPGGLWKWLLIE